MDDARSFLFVTWEGGGNVPPVLGTARRLAQRGHQVRVLTEPCLRGAVEGIGAAFVPFTEHFTRDNRSEVLMEDWKATSPPAAIRSSLDNVILGPAGPTAYAIGRAIDAEPADVIVTDWMLPVGVAVGEARGIPTAVLFHCINMMPAPGRPAVEFPPARGPLGRLRDGLVNRMSAGVINKSLPAYNKVREGLGLGPLADVWDQFAEADRVLVQTSPAFDFLGDPDPANVVYTGPVLDEPDWVEGVAWESPWSKDDPRPLVLVSLSSTFQDQRATLQAALDALGPCDVRGLATLGPAMETEAFRVPGNVVAVGQAPHGQVFPHADAFITHCGHGSVMRALAHGVPLVALPMGRDQDATATRIVERGVGLKPKARPGPIAEAVRRVLDEPAFRRSAERLGARVREEAAADRAVAEIEAIALDRGPVRRKSQPVLA